MAQSHNSRYMDDLTDSSSESKDVVVYIVDLTKGRFIYMGSSIFEMTGYLPGFFVKNGFKAFFEILHEEDFARVKEKYINTLWRPRTETLEYSEVICDLFRINCKEGGKVWIENTMVILNYSSENAPKKVLGYFRQQGPEHFTDIEERINSLQKIILKSKPPQGIVNLASLKNWVNNTRNTAQVEESLLQVAFQGKLNFKLTKREKEILKFVADGYSAREIAEMLFISESTVVTHRKHLLHKFEVKNVAELIKVASKYFHFN